MEAIKISHKLVWLKRFRIAWLSQKEWSGFIKRNWWLSFKKHKHWRGNGIYAHSYQFSIIGLNIAYLIPK